MLISTFFVKELWKNFLCDWIQYASDFMRGVRAEGFLLPIKIDVRPLIFNSFARRRRLCVIKSDASKKLNEIKKKGV